MKVKKLVPVQDQIIPDGVLRLEYQSDYDGLSDWTLLWPPNSRKTKTWIVCIHGHGSNGDQLYTRSDMRNYWLSKFRSCGSGILTPNLRGNAWMSPAVAFDLQTLLNFLRDEYGARRFVFASGSMGGTSNLIYAVLHPKDVTIVLALCPAIDLSSYCIWCRKHNTETTNAIANAIEVSYGGTPDKIPEVYDGHSVLKHTDRLTMPVCIVHGCQDEIIPISQSRSLVGKMKNAQNLVYLEVPDGDHNSPLNITTAFDWLAQKTSG